MGINVKIQNLGKPVDVITVQAKLEQDLKSCMRCRFFYGNSRQCILKKCFKEHNKAEVMEHEKEDTEPKLPQNGDKMNPWMFGSIGAVLLSTEIAFFLWRRKKEQSEI